MGGTVGGGAVGGRKTGATVAATATTGEDLSVDEPLLAYLREHQESTKYLVAVQTSTASVPIILATGEPVVTDEPKGVAAFILASVEIED